MSRRGEKADIADNEHGSGAPVPLAANQLLLTFPEDGPYSLSRLHEWAAACGVPLHDVAIAATAHALSPYRYSMGEPHRVRALDDAIYGHQ